MIGRAVGQGRSLKGQSWLIGDLSWVKCYLKDKNMKLCLKCLPFANGWHVRMFTGHKFSLPVQPMVSSRMSSMD